MVMALKTLDTDFAAAMMARGARMDGWEISPDGRKLYWQLKEIDPQWMEDYRKGADGIVKYMQSRKFLVNVAKTEIINQTERKSNGDSKNKSNPERRPQPAVCDNR